MELYPHNIDSITEFDKVKERVAKECQSQWAKNKARKLKPSAKKHKVIKEQEQTYEYFNILVSGLSHPEIKTADFDYILKILSIENSTLSMDAILNILNCLDSYRHWHKWLKNNNDLYPELHKLFPKKEDAKEMEESIKSILDDKLEIRDDASEELLHIRKELKDFRHKLQVQFERELRKARKNKQLASTQEAFLNMRRLLAVLSEYKRQIPGVIHGESDTQKTTYIEPQATIPLNNEIRSLESEEQSEINRILKELTAKLSPYREQLDFMQQHLSILDFIRAKALYAVALDACKVQYSPHAIVDLQKVYHPLLKEWNDTNKEETIPLNIVISQQHQIIVISGPNAGGKTVSLKTIILTQMMFQSGLLLACDPSSSLGIFDQIFVEIGDSQSIDLKLSTYSAHLQDMKYLLSTAHSRSLFCIDELGSGSDPHLGGVFAEVIMEKLAQSKAKGVVTTHYLNLKTMADNNPHMVNAAMVFDEEKLLPKYKLEMGKPGSSYTFSIAQRVGIEEDLIEKAKNRVQKEHFQLEQLLRETEKKMQELEKKERELVKKEREYDKSKKRYDALADKEEFQRQEKLQRLQNQIKKEELDNLRDLDRKFKQLIHDWKKAENKKDVIQEAENLLFDRKTKQSNKKIESKTNKNFRKTHQELAPGKMVQNIENHQIGKIENIEGNKAQVRIGKLPFIMNLDKLVTVEPRQSKDKPKKRAKKS